MVGIVLCFYGGISLNGSKGDLLALCAALSFSMLAIIIKKSGAEGSMQALIWGNLYAVIATVPNLFISKAVIVSDIPLFIILGIFQMVLPFYLYARGQETLGTMEASLFKLLEPVVAPVWVALLIYEIPSIFSIFGGVLVIAALFIKTFGDYRSR